MSRSPHRALVLAALAAAALALPAAAFAKDRSEQASTRDKLAFFDSRQTPQARIVLRGKARKLAESPNPAVEALRDTLGSEGVIDVDPLTSTPRMVGRLDGFLTGPSSASPSSVALGYVSANAAAFGLSPETMRGLELARDYVSIDGVHHLFYVQKVNGVPVFGNGLKANVTKDGRLINVLGSPVASPSVGSTSPGLSASGAIASARRDAEQALPPVRALPGSETPTRQTTFSNGDRASLVLFQGVDGLRLAWQTFVSGPSVSFLHVVDASTGAVLYRRSLVQAGNALVWDNYPGAANGGAATAKSLDQPGWNTSSTELHGNNALVYSDVNDNNAEDAGEEIPPSDGSGNYSYPLTPFDFGSALNAVYGCAASSPCTYDPRFPAGSFSFETNRKQTGTQLYYFLNVFHDHLAAPPIGFTEAAGNFQATNPSGQGAAGDPVLGESIDGADTLCCVAGNTVGLPDPNHSDNANMATPPDGFSPRMQMYLWHDPLTDLLLGPEADPFLPASGSDEADIVYHEYTHGLSNRLVVDALGNSTLGNVQAGSMGEAWSDWYAVDFLVKQGLFTDTAADGELRIGPYVARGADLIRTEPIDCPVGSTSPSCPGDATHAGGYTYGDFGTIIGRPEVHADGEIWGQTLWDLRNALGSDTTESLVTRAMELSPANPSFLDMRNAILQADLVQGGSHRDAVWGVFAHRGMGYFSAALNGDDARPVEDFSLPPGAKAKTAKLKGTVTDADTHQPLAGAVVAFGGHASGFPGDLVGVTNGVGRYDVKKVFVGTYPKVSASAPGFDTVVTTKTIAQGENVLDFSLRRDWASLAGGGQVTAFDGPDYTGFGCGPTGAIDQSLGTGWGSDTDHDALNTGFVTPKSVTIKLPVAVNVAEVAVDPSNTCGDAGSASTKDFRLETSTDGTTWKVVREGSFGVANRGRLNTLSGLDASGLGNVRYVRFTMLNPQVPNPDGTLPPFGQEAVHLRCGPGAPNPGNFSGCTFMDMSEIEVYGAPA